MLKKTLKNAAHDPRSNQAERMGIPFYSANTHRNAAHAAAGMMLHALAGGRVGRSRGPDGLKRTDYQYWEQFTGVPTGSRYATVGGQTLASYSARGYSLMIIGAVDYTGFAKDGLPALSKKRAEEFAAVSHSRAPGWLVAEQYSIGSIINKFVDRGGYKPQPAVAADIQLFHANGWAVQLEVNGRLLDGESGYVTQPLVVTGVNAEGIIAHNPGGRGQQSCPSQEISFDELFGPWEAAGFVMHAVGRVTGVGNDIRSLELEANKSPVVSATIAA